MVLKDFGQYKEIPFEMYSMKSHRHLKKKKSFPFKLFKVILAIFYDSLPSVFLESYRLISSISIIFPDIPRKLKNNAALTHDASARRDLPFVLATTLAAATSLYLPSNLR